MTDKAHHKPKIGDLSAYVAYGKALLRQRQGVELDHGEPTEQQRTVAAILAGDDTKEQDDDAHETT